MITRDLALIAAEGEGQKIEFKAKAAGLAREMVALANASGGSIFLGIADDGAIVGVTDSNRLRSEIQAAANTCDPRVSIRIVPRGKVLEVVVLEGMDKPYRCSEGFFLRIGPNSQQLTRDEILRFAIRGGKVRFDEQFLSECDPAKDLEPEAVQAFRRKRNLPASAKPADILVNLSVAQVQAGRVLLTRAALLFFGRDPQRFFPEAYVTCARYADPTRASVLDRADARGHHSTRYPRMDRAHRQRTSGSLRLDGWLTVSTCGNSAAIRGERGRVWSERDLRLCLCGTPKERTPPTAPRGRITHPRARQTVGGGNEPPGMRRMRRGRISGSRRGKNAPDGAFLDERVAG